MRPASAETITTLRRRPLVLSSLVLYALGLIVLLSPVTTGIPSDERISDGIGNSSRTCGVTLVQAFATPPPGVEGSSRDSALDCASTARGRVGYGLLLLLVAVPVGAAALLSEGRNRCRTSVPFDDSARDRVR
jgi:hypothetical protein